MTCRALRHTLALPVLLAALVSVVLPTPALADQSKGHGRGQQDRSGYERYSEQRDDSQQPRDNGRNYNSQSDRAQQRQYQRNSDAQNDYRSSRGEQSGRDHSNEQYQTRDDRNRNNGSQAQQYQQRDDRYNSNRNTQQYQSLSPQQAAQRARSQYGGQVLKVQPGAQGFQVRILKDDGRVVTVPIAD